MEPMKIRRLAATVACPCGRANDVLIPAPECGTEFVWNLRCRSCGAFAWFHAKRDRAFVDAVVATRKRRGEADGLSEEGTREAHAAYAATLPACACGGRRSVVRKWEDEPCLACGRALGARTDGAREIEIEEARC